MSGLAHDMQGKLAADLNEAKEAHLLLRAAHDTLYDVKRALDDKLGALSAELATLTTNRDALQASLSKEREGSAAERAAFAIQLAEAQGKVADAVATEAAMRSELDKVLLALLAEHRHAWVHNRSRACRGLLVARYALARTAFAGRRPLGWSTGRRRSRGRQGGR